MNNNYPKITFLFALSLLFLVDSYAQTVIDNSIRDGGEYHLYNMYYNRVL